MSTKQKTNSGAPSLRFKEFTDEWEIHRIGEFIYERTEYADDNLPLYSLTIENGITPKSERYERSFLITTDNESYKTVYPNDFAFNPMNLRFGAIARHRGTRKVKVSKYYNIFAVNGKANPNFLEYYFKLHPMIIFYNRMATGSLIEKQRVHFLDFIKFLKPFPLKDEQDKIASFFSLIDELIDNFKNQKNELEIYRKGVIQEFFSQSIRSKNSNIENSKAWVTKSLGELFNERNDRNGENVHQLLSVKIHGGVVLQGDTNKTDSSNSDKSKYKVVKVGDIAYNTMRMWQGASGVSQYEGIVSPAYTVVYPKKGDANFYGYLFKHPRTIFNFYRYSQGLTSDTWNLKFQHFSEVEVTVPSDIEEQKRIAAFLSSLDELIEHKEKQIALAEQWKKGLLQQMFI